MIKMKPAIITAAIVALMVAWIVSFCYYPVVSAIIFLGVVAGFVILCIYVMVDMFLSNE